MGRLAAFLAILIAALGPAAAHAADSPQAHRVTGHARGNDAGARDRAVDMALREAVLGVLQERVPVARITPYEGILDRARDFVLDMRIVDFETRDGISTIELAVRLEEASLLRAIADAWLDDAAFMPRVAALTAFRQDGDPYRVIEGHPAQESLEKALSDAGLEVTGLADIARFTDAAELDAIAQRAADEAPQLARAHLCDAAVVLLATVDAEPVQGSANVFGVTAEVAMLVASSRDGVPVHVEQTQALVHGADPDAAAEAAIHSAVMRLSRSAFPIVVLAAAAVEAREDDIVVTVDGVLDAAQLEALINRFAGVQGVAGVEVLFHARRGCRLRVAFPGDPAGFIEPALHALPPTPSLEVERIIGREMRLRVRENGE